MNNISNITDFLKYKFNSICECDNGKFILTFTSNGFIICKYDLIKEKFILVSLFAQCKEFKGMSINQRLNKLNIDYIVFSRKNKLDNIK